MDYMNQMIQNNLLIDYEKNYKNSVCINFTKINNSNKKS